MEQFWRECSRMHLSFKRKLFNPLQLLLFPISLVHIHITHFVVQSQQWCMSKLSSSTLYISMMWWVDDNAKKKKKILARVAWKVGVRGEGWSFLFLPIITMDSSNSNKGNNPTNQRVKISQTFLSPPTPPFPPPPSILLLKIVLEKQMHSLFTRSLQIAGIKSTERVKQCDSLT